MWLKGVVSGSHGHNKPIKGPKPLRFWQSLHATIYKQTSGIVVANYFQELATMTNARRGQDLYNNNTS